MMVQPYAGHIFPSEKGGSWYCKMLASSLKTKKKLKKLFLGNELRDSKIQVSALFIYTSEVM
jgi:hypothetical protein